VTAVTPQAEGQEPPQPSQAHSFRRLTRDTLVYLSGTVLSRLVSFIMLPVYTRYLTPNDYGILQILDLAMDVAAILVSAGATAGTVRFYFKAKTDEERKNILATAFAIQVVLNTVGTALLLLVSPLIWKHALGGEGTLTMVRIAALNFTLGSVLGVPTALMQVRQQAGRFVVMNLVKLGLQLGLNILFVVGLKLGPTGVLLSSTVTYVVLGISLGVMLVRYTGFRFKWDIYKNFRRYGVPYQIATAGTFILAYGDRFFLEHYHNLAVVGIYGVAYQFGFLLTGNIAGPFMRAWSPQRHMLVTAPRAVRDERYNRGALYGSLMLVTAAVGISLFIRPVLQIMVTESFRTAAPFVPVILLAYLMQAWTSVVDFGIGVAEETKYSTYATWIAVVVCLILYAVLIPPLAGMGAAIATLVAMFVRLVLHYYWSQRLWPVSYELRPHLKLLAYGIAVVIPTFLLIPDRLVPQLVAGSALLGAYAVLVWRTVLHDREREMIGSLLHSPRDFAKLLAGA